MSFRRTEFGDSTSSISDPGEGSRKSINSAETGIRSYFTSYSAYESGSVPSRTSKSYENPIVALKEQRAVFRARVVVFVVLAIALAAVTFIMYWVIAANEHNEYKVQFLNYASEISSLVQDSCKSAVDSAETFSTMVTSSAIEAGKEWPYVSITDFTSKAKRLSTLSGAYQIIYSPIIYGENITEWTLHSFENLPAYFAEAIKVNGYDTTVEHLMNTTLPFPWRYNQKNPLDGPVRLDPLEPEPVIPLQLIGLRKRIGFYGFFINWQTLEFLEPFYSFSQGQVMPTNIELLNGGFEDALATAYEFNIPAFDSYRNPVIDTVNMELIRYESQTQMVQPIFDTIYNGDRSRKELRMVGALTLLFDWESLLSNLLSKAGISDLDIILSGTCSLLARPVTYRLKDGAVVEVGTEDLHDTQYDDIGRQYPLFELDLDEETQSLINEIIGQQIEVSVEGGCISDIIMGIYPTAEFEQSFYTGTAWKFSAGVAGVFVFTSLVFLVYDVMVKRRQAKVMERVIHQDKIVLNTFPKAIRDKMYKESNRIREEDYSGKFSTGHNSFNNSESSIFGSGSLADLYPNATVVFADIVGFTAWSSAREPNQVFKL